MAVKTKKADPVSDLEKDIAALEAKLGKGVVRPASMMPPVYHLPFMSPHMNYATEGGAPWERVVALAGAESCLAGSTMLNYQAKTPEGKMRDGKGGTLERLYERFNNVQVSRGHGKHLHHEVDSVYSLPSVDEEGKIIHNRVMDVLKTGVKECLRIKTNKGLVVETTPDHMFMTVDGFVPASALVEGGYVVVHDKTPFRGRAEVRPRRKETTVKHHLTASQKVVNGCRYHRLKQSQLVLEADINDLSVDEYRSRLNSGDLRGLIFIDTALTHIHHVDENAENDHPLNLALLTPQEHGRLHVPSAQKRMSFIAVEHEILSIESVGERETYDVKMAAPYNNFVADGFVVHNCGKTLCALELVAMAQALPGSAEAMLVPRVRYHRDLGDYVTLPGGEKVYTADRLEDEIEWIRENFPDGARCLWHDIEGQFDKKRAQAVGIDTDALYMTELTVIEDFGYALPFGYKNYHLQVLDSTSAASSMLKLKQEPGQSAGYGVDARAWKDIFRGSMTYFGHTKNGSGIPNMVVLIHQMSTNMRTGGSQAMSTKFLKHTSSCSITFTRGQFLWRKDGVLTDGKVTGVDDSSMAGMAEPDGLEVFVKLEKSRTSRPFRVGAMHFDYRTLRYPLAAELASSGLYHGILRQNGSWFYVVDHNGEQETLGQGLKVVYARLIEDEVLRTRIMCRLLSYEDE